MGIHRQPTLAHWNYFLALEDDLSKLSRYIDFDGRNDSAFSLEISRILFSASSEIDVVLKQLCLTINIGSTANNINAYFNEITPTIPSFCEFKVTIPRFGLTLEPWNDWKATASPEWWQAYNKVKHERHLHFDKATLKNCLNSVAALYISVLHLYMTEATNGELMLLPQLFNVTDLNFAGTRMGRYGNTFVYKF